MAIKDWTTNYPTNLDTDVNQETLVDGADNTRVSHVLALRDAIIELEILVGADSLESGSLRKRVDDLEGVTTTPAGEDGYVQFNDSGSFGAAALIYDDSGIVSIIDEGNTEFRVSSFGDSSVPKLKLRSARGTSSSPEAVEEGDLLGEYLTYAYDGTSNENCFSIGGYAAEDWSTSGSGSYLSFSSIREGSSTLEEKFRFNDKGQLLIGHTEALFPGSSMEIVSNSYSIYFHGQYGVNNFGKRPCFISCKGRGTISSIQPTQDGDTIGKLSFSGYVNSSNIVESASIVAEATGNWTTAPSTPNQMLFKTTTNGSTSSDIKFVIQDSGEISSTYMYSNYTIGGTNKDVYIDSSGYVGVISSSERFKQNINNMEDISWIYNLRPVNFNYLNTPGKKQYGLIAEEVEVINSDIVTHNRVFSENEQGDFDIEDGYVDGVTYTKLIPIMISAVHSLNERIQGLENQ